MKDFKLIRNFHASKTTLSWIETLCDWKNVSNETYRLFIHLLSISVWRIKYDNEEYTSPIFRLQGNWIQNIVKAKDFKILIDIGLVFCDKSYIVGIRSKSYWISLDIIKSFQKRILKNKHEINIVDGKKTRIRSGRTLPTDTKQMALFDENKHPITSKLIIQSIRELTKNRTMVNISELRKYTEKFNKLWYHLESKASFFMPHWFKRKKKIFKALNKANKLLFFLEQFPIGEIFASYPQNYNPVYTGRIYEMNNGLQSSSNKIKKLLTTDLEFKNLDIKNCQLQCLAYFLDDEKLKQRILTKSKNIYNIAEGYGIPKKLVKKAIFGIIFSIGKKNNIGIRKLREYAEENNLSNIEDFISGLDVFIIGVKKLLHILKKKKENRVWINHCGIKITEKILKVIADEKLLKRSIKYKEILPIYFKTDKYLQYQKDKTLIAFYLQGLEAYIVHSLTVMHNDNYKVFSNQHDGILVKESYYKKEKKYTVIEYISHNMKLINSELNITNKKNLFELVEKPF